MSEKERQKNDELIRSALRNAAERDHRARRLLELRNFEMAERSDVEAIARILLDEFAATGIADNSEPTQRGLEIEAAIDWIRRSIGPRPK